MVDGISSTTLMFLESAKPKTPVQILDEFMNRKFKRELNFEEQETKDGRLIYSVTLPNGTVSSGVPTCHKETSKESCARIVLDALIQFGEMTEEDQKPLIGTKDPDALFWLSSGAAMENNSELFLPPQVGPDIKFSHCDNAEFSFGAPPVIKAVPVNEFPVKADLDPLVIKGTELIQSGFLDGLQERITDRTKNYLQIVSKPAFIALRELLQKRHQGVPEISVFEHKILKRPSLFVGYVPLAESENGAIFGWPQPSKKAAKSSCAMIYLDYVLSILGTEADTSLRSLDTSITASSIEEPLAKRPKSEASNAFSSEDQDMKAEGISSTTVVFLKSAKPKTPVQILNEFMMKKFKRQSEFLEQKTEDGSVFVTLPNGKQIAGLPQCKKIAKHSCARKALDDLMHSGEMTDEDQKLFVSTAMDPDALFSLNSSNNLCSAGNMSLARFLYAKLLTTVKENLQYLYRRDLDNRVAGFVLLNSNGESEVISWATGSKQFGSVRSEGISVLRDSHAEVLCRRGLLRYLYYQIQVHYSNDKASIFKKSSTSTKLELKPNYSIHFLCSSAPCGDATAWSPYESEESTSKEHYAFLEMYGDLQVKIPDAQEPLMVCNVPLDNTNRVMSCTDKILKWNALGVQGCLLTQFLMPIYISSFVFHHQFTEKHVNRGLCCRIGGLMFDVEGYRVNHATCRTCFDKTQDSPESLTYQDVTANWNSMDNTVELTGAFEGLHINTSQPSRLSQAELFKLFKSTQKAAFDVDFPAGLTYEQTKKMTPDYYNMRSKLRTYLTNERFGTWVGKDAQE
ncbi:hypothetical protein L596_019269 [Steinernema carpocapsae]|uniref:A to I editase domain-containing protein n=1 Tax=Steinernema carpocapsae TaxID=34508 RepID=A0A4U5MPX3_STECR|nr:hypothetical protein L596_019269 [Steinernema carpocapsae]